MNYWLIKSEPDVYSIDDLKRDRTTCWEGVRNYQARNFIRSMKKGDICLYYHSNAKPSGIVGLARVSKEAYPDDTAFDKKAKYYDPKSDPDKPRWFMMDVQFKEKFNTIISLEQIKQDSALKNMVLVNNSRLSVQPVTEKEFNHILNHHRQNDL